MFFFLSLSPLPSNGSSCTYSDVHAHQSPHCCFSCWSPRLVNTNILQKTLQDLSVPGFSGVRLDCWALVTLFCFLLPLDGGIMVRPLKRKWVLDPCLQYRSTSSLLLLQQGNSARCNTIFKIVPFLISRWIGQLVLGWWWLQLQTTTLRTNLCSKAKTEYKTR